MKSSVLALLLWFQIAPAAGLKVSGRVIDGTTRRPSAGVIVNLWMASVPRQTRTAANGDFSFAGLPNGHYHLRAERAPMASMPVVIDLADRDESGLGLVLGVGGANGMPSTPFVPAGDVLIQLPNVGVPGSIAVEGGRPLPEADRPITFTLTNADSVATRIVPDLTKDGFFRLGMLEGEYKLAVGDLPRGYVLKALTYGEANLQNTPLKVTAFPTSAIVVTLAAEKP